MATIEIVTVDNKKAGSVELSPKVFEAEVKEHLLHAEVRRQLAARQRGTHSTRNRAAVSGGGTKPYRQKGTGRARQGTIRAPQWAGGGVVFGPVPRGHDHRLPKKVRRAALRSALSHHVKEGSVMILEALEIEGYRTRRIAEILNGLGLAGEKVLIVIAEEDALVERSARNLRGVAVVRAVGLNVFDVLRHRKLVMTQAALEAVEKRLGDTPQEAEA